MTIETRDYLSTAQAAERLGVDTDTVKRYCNSKPQRLKGIKLGNAWLIHKDEIERYRQDESTVGRPKNNPRRRRKATG